MSKNIVEELPARKHAPAAAPAAKKEGGKKPEAKSGGKATGSVEESSEKKIRQAVYDIRYRARREDIDLKAAFSQYMSNSSLSQAERTAVREKLFGKAGGGVKEHAMLNVDDIASDNIANALYKVFVEKIESKIDLKYLKQLEEDQKPTYQVRIVDKNGTSYVRNADREKITQLRQNPNIKSVEMSDHGEPYEGKKAQKIVNKKGKKKAKKDFDGDGKVESPSKEHAGAVHNAIQRKKGGTPDGKDTRKNVQSSVQYAYDKIFISDGTITTEPKGKHKVTGEGVDNYKSGAVKVAPVNKGEEDPSITSAKGGIYASFAHQKMLDVIAEKAACKKTSKEKVEEATVNTKECEKKPEEKEKDMRGTYAKINLVKNKLRSAGCKNVMVSVDDIDEGAYETVKKILDRGTKFVDENPVGQILGKIVQPWKKTDGGDNRKSATKQSQEELINNNVK